MSVIQQACTLRCSAAFNSQLGRGSTYLCLSKGGASIEDGVLLGRAASSSAVLAWCSGTEAGSAVPVLSGWGGAEARAANSSRFHASSQHGAGELCKQGVGAD